MKKWYFFCFLLGVAAPLSAQEFGFKLDNSVEVAIDNKPLLNPWTGGLNGCQFSTMRLDADSVDDLVVFDRSAGRVLTFVADQKRWKYAPQYEMAFPADVANWMLLVDYDRDGRKDMFTYALQGLRIFRNVPNADAGFRWQLIQDNVRTEGFSGSVNLLVAASDVPAITDVDGDGDVDVLTFDQSGNFVEFHKNLSIEKTGKNDTFSFKRMGLCWGNFIKEHCNDFRFGFDCSGGNTNGRAARQGETERILHAGNAILVQDFNGDGRRDVLFGHISCTNIAFLKNAGGNDSNANINSFEANFPVKNPVDIVVFPAPYLEDVDFDGVKDLLVSPNTSGNEKNEMNLQQSIWMYKNAGSDKLPSFDLQQKDFLQDQTIDVGENAAPALADYDGDGDLDLFVGNQSLRGSAGLRANVSLYHNAGTANKPRFERRTDDYLGLSQGSQLSNLKPFFADVNSDGTPDYGWVANTFRGMEIRYIPNQAARGRAFLLDLKDSIQLPRPERLANGENVLFYDVDADGKTDMLLGKNFGSVQYYRNTTGGNRPKYELRNETFAGFDVDFNNRSPALTVVDLNGDQKKELVTVNYDGQLRVFGNFDPEKPLQKIDSNLVFSELDNKFKFVRLGGSLQVAAGDLDGDKLPDLILGTNAGGLRLLKNVSANKNQPETTADAALVYPNPASRFVYVRAPFDGTVGVFGVTGQRVAADMAFGANAETSIDLSALPQGVYLVRLTDGQGQSIVRKVLVLR